nr:unnamed protein product [Digitaria exilis]
MEVAVSLYLGCLGTVPEKLQALANECSHIKGLRKQLVFLKDELVAMRAFLLKVAAMEQEGPLDIQLKVWAQDVRETSYDVEDCVDDFTRSLHLAGEGKKQQGSNMITDFFRKCSQTLLTLRTWHEFADTFEELKARVVDAGDRWERYKLDGLGCCSSNLTMDPWLSALFTDENHLAGIERPSDELVRWLVGPEGGLATHTRVVSIVGFGGLGKTTLARQVYLKLALGNQISGDTEAWDEVKIIAEIRDYLADKRGMGYIVFEDGVLPKLEGLSIPLSVSMAKGYDFYVGIVHLRSLTHAKVILGKDGATPSEVKAAAESIEKEVSANPNNPKVSIEESQRPGDNSEE